MENSCTIQIIPCLAIVDNRNNLGKNHEHCQLNVVLFRIARGFGFDVRNELFNVGGCGMRFEVVGFADIL